MYYFCQGNHSIVDIMGITFGVQVSSSNSIELLFEPRAKSQEPRAKSQEPRAKSQEPRAKSQEPRAKSQEPRAKSKNIILSGVEGLQR
ncbi:hypothetical protein [Maribacter sp. 2308TA10-17]|uniref:hypothetical protein n=1 Tax=Maribacter sp. 2308TA10-17 TaxID=3386276 RepID=UPI0039BC8023